MATKVEIIGLKRLRNAEHATFHLEVKLFIEKCGAEHISATEELVLYTKAIDSEVEVINRQLASSLTKDLEEKDKARDDLLSYLFACINNAKHAPLSAYKEAYKQLTPVIAPYHGITYKPTHQETAEIIGLVSDLRKDTFATHITTLALSDVLTLIEKTNNEYIALDQQRTSEIPSKTDMAGIRQTVDTVYETLIDKTNATMILVPNDSATTLVQQLNNHIGKTKSAVHHRSAKRTGKIEE